MYYKVYIYIYYSHIYILQSRYDYRGSFLHDTRKLYTLYDQQLTWTRPWKISSRIPGSSVKDLVVSLLRLLLCIVRNRPVGLGLERPISKLSRRIRSTCDKRLYAGSVLGSSRTSANVADTPDVGSVALSAKRNGKEEIFKKQHFVEMFRAKRLDFLEITWNIDQSCRI